MTETQLLHARTLIGLLHPTPSHAALIEITGLAPKAKPVKRYLTDVAIAAEVAVELNQSRYSVFVALNPRKAMSGFEHDVPYVSTFGLDLQPERTPIDAILGKLVAAGAHPTARAVSGHGEHAYYRVAAAEPHRAKLVWERLCKFTGSDPVFNVNRIFRCAGTCNWKKDPPKWCYLLGVWPERVYTIEQLDYVLTQLGAPPARSPKEGIPVPVDPPADWAELRRRLPGSALDIIDTGEKNAYSEKQVTRSEADWVVICALIRAGATDEMIHWIYEKTPVGQLKYRESGPRYLNRTIEAARRAAVVRQQGAPMTGMRSRYSTAPSYTGGAGDRRWRQR